MKILIVGLGSIGLRHLRLSRSLLATAEIKVLSRKKHTLNPKFSNGTFESLKEGVAFAPDIAVIANAATLHLESAQALAMAGAHIFVEKPLSTSTIGVSELIETCKRESTLLMIGYNLRFSPSLLHFKFLLNEGLIGRALSVRCEVGQYLPNWRPGSDYRQSVSSVSELGGGVLLELSHEIDYLRWIFGEVSWVRATLRRQSDLEINVEDSAHLILGFSPNTEGKQLTCALNLDFIRHDYTRLCTVIGEKGSLRWNGLTGAVEIFRQDAPDWVKLFRHKPQRDETYVAEWNDFLNCIKEKRVPKVTGEDGLKVIEIIEAARLSANSGIEVAIPHPSRINRSIS
jgi:predicted dehydrogenase